MADKFVIEYLITKGTPASRDGGIIRRDTEEEARQALREEARFLRRFLYWIEEAELQCPDGRKVRII